MRDGITRIGGRRKAGLIGPVFARVPWYWSLMGRYWEDSEDRMPVKGKKKEEIDK